VDLFVSIEQILTLELADKTDNSEEVTSVCFGYYKISHHISNRRKVIILLITVVVFAIVANVF